MIWVKLLLIPHLRPLTNWRPRNPRSVTPIRDDVLGCSPSVLRPGVYDSLENIGFSQVDVAFKLGLNNYWCDFKAAPFVDVGNVTLGPSIRGEQLSLDTRLNEFVFEN